MSLSPACYQQLARLDRGFGQRTSLCPERPYATPLEEVGQALFVSIEDPDRQAAFTEGISQIAQAQQENFPHNIFGDLDFLAASLLYERQHDLPHHHLRSVDEIQHLCERVAGLQGVFGERSVIRFRYVHDFVYGFDWARWVQKDPKQRASIGPFDLPFLSYLEKRAGELRELIEQDDEKYHKLRDERHRNPFTFSRDPQDEEKLHRELAKRQYVPVCAWSIRGPALWEKPYSQTRKTLATELGIPTK
ncbi:MAG: ferrochelatase [Myxococcales bacterium]|nr:ferrochelatase [Myxococcales bacterium]MCB9641990.1 ferrochelatase [Myxococcales bacterium]